MSKTNNEIPKSSNNLNIERKSKLRFTHHSNLGSILTNVNSISQEMDKMSLNLRRNPALHRSVKRNLTSSCNAEFDLLSPCDPSPMCTNFAQIFNEFQNPYENLRTNTKRDHDDSRLCEDDADMTLRASVNIHKQNEAVQTSNLLEFGKTKASKAIQVDHEYIKPYLKESNNHQRSNDRYAKLNSRLRNSTTKVNDFESTAACNSNTSEDLLQSNCESNQIMQTRKCKRGKTSHSIVLNSDCNLIKRLIVSRFRNNPENRYTSVIKDVPTERLRVMPLKKKILPHCPKPTDYYKIKTKLQKLNENLSSAVAGEASKSLIRFKNK